MILDYIANVADTALENVSATQPKPFVGYIKDTPNRARDKGRLVLVGGIATTCPRTTATSMSGHGDAAERAARSLPRDVPAGHEVARATRASDTPKFRRL